MMNAEAQRLGMRSAHFVNSSGLPDPAHQMSTRDIAVLAAAIIRDFPEHYAWYSQKEFTYNNITQQNRNKLLWRDASVDGLKTGHTNAAGYCLVGSAERSGTRWIAVVLGAKDEASREREVMKLLEYGFANFDAMQLLNQQQGVATVDVFKGESDSVLLQTLTPSYVVLPRGQQMSLKTEISVSSHYLAPVATGQILGLATVSLDDKKLLETPLVSVNTINSGSFFKRLGDSVRLFFHSKGEG
jgi:D-alanyl-D-alanine carboxypeptidase (penicillin-binding protein 5/6)